MMATTKNEHNRPTEKNGVSSKSTRSVLVPKPADTCTSPCSQLLISFAGLLSSCERLQRKEEAPEDPSRESRRKKSGRIQLWYAKQPNRQARAKDPRSGQCIFESGCSKTSEDAGCWIRSDCDTADKTDPGEDGTGVSPDEWRESEGTWG